MMMKASWVLVYRGSVLLVFAELVMIKVIVMRGISWSAVMMVKLMRVISSGAGDDDGEDGAFEEAPMMVTIMLREEVVDNCLL